MALAPGSSARGAKQIKYIALHEQSYLDHLEANGLPVVRIDGGGVDTHALTQTLDAMRGGAPIIAQGTLQAARWGGRPDILRRVRPAVAMDRHNRCRSKG